MEFKIWWGRESPGNEDIAITRNENPRGPKGENLKQKENLKAYGKPRVLKKIHGWGEQRNRRSYRQWDHGCLCEEGPALLLRAWGASAVLIYGIP